MQGETRPEDVASDVVCGARCELIFVMRGEVSRCIPRSVEGVAMPSTRSAVVSVNREHVVERSHESLFLTEMFT